MSALDLHYLELHELTDLIQTGEISPVEVTKAAFARIELLDPKLRSFARTTVDLALTQAQQAEREISRGRDTKQAPRGTDRDQGSVLDERRADRGRHGAAP